MLADLTYNILAERLHGMLGSLVVNEHAVSGGRAGSTDPGAVNPMLANNPFLTGIKKGVHHESGGAIPQGAYRLVTHESRPKWIRLVPALDRLPGGRAGFAIHGRGEWGSDGCIVPMRPMIALQLRHALEVHEKLKKPAPTLRVIAVGDTARFERMLNTA